MDITLQAKVSKAVAPHTETSYAQAYNAGKLYITLALYSSKKGLPALGKETLERLQREFFALDVKDLETIKKAVEETVQSLPEETDYSITLATPVEEVLYVVTAGVAYAALSRNDDSYIIAEGEKGKVLGFSGELKPADTIMLLTQDFLKTIPFQKVSSALLLSSADEAAESLAPLLIENPTGGEAALILSTSQVVTPVPAPITETDAPIQDEKDERKPAKKMQMPKIQFPQINIEKLKHLSRKQMAIVAAAVLVVVLLGGIFFEQMNRSNNERSQKLQTILEKQEKAYEDATAIVSLNRSLAVEELTAIKTDVEKELPNFPKNSSQYKTLQEFLQKVNDIIGGGGGTAATPAMFYAGNSTLRPQYITFKAGTLVVSGTDTIQILTTDGKTTEDYDAEGVGQVSANEENAYLLVDKTIYRVSKSNGADTEIIKDLGSVHAFDVFGNNVYALTNTILRFRANSFEKENYLTDGISLSKPTSMSIDSSIWVLDNGKIRKFTKGAEDNFSLKGDLPLSESAMIYTDEDYKNVYILDPGKKFIAIIDKDGNLVKNLELTKVPNVTSFAANEKDGKIYLVSDGNIYSIDF